MKILLVYPETPRSFWGYHDALKFISKKASEPPLGLLTVAAMLPNDWEPKLIDMNSAKLKDSDLLRADFVFLSGMSIHVNSFREVIRRCNVLGVKIIAGGPLATTEYKNLQGVDHFILNEAEITFPEFLADFNNGQAKQIYKSDKYPEMSLSPIPRWDLLNMKKYATMDIQYSRGCPYDCEFCNITALNGLRPRVKNKEQFLSELEVLYNLGWKGEVFVVDDNFIGNKRILKKELLPDLIKWSKKKNYPFKFICEVSINLSDDDELINLMLEAGFYNIFIGIETPNDISLMECGKKQNLKRSLNESISKLQKAGFIVAGGFIIGFDNDPSNIFDRQIEFIQNNGIVTAMVGILNAPFGTKLFKRLRKENRLLESFGGNNMDGTMNFKPSMPYKELINGYARVVKTIYSQKEYYYRVKTFLKNYNMPNWHSSKISFTELKAFFRILWKLGILEEGRKYFWKLLIYSLSKHPKKFSLAMTFAVYGFHYRRIAALI